MTDHQLNKLLADVAGLTVWESEGKWFVQLPNGITAEWFPLGNHNDMALVKAGLRKQGYDYDIDWDHKEKIHTVDVYNMEELWPDRVHRGMNQDELRAIGEAIAKMKEVSDE